MGTLRIFLLVVAGSYLSLLAMLFAAQRRFLYYPSHTWVPLQEAHANPEFREISAETEDGIELKARFAPPTRKPLIIVFFHGNGDCLSTAVGVADPYIAAGYGFVLAEYRGYSGLPGSPSEAGLYKDGRAYLHWLAGHGIGGERVVLFGHSLGTGVAIEIAKEFPVRGVMLLAPYLSMAKMAQIHLPYFPARLLVLDRFENDRKIGELHMPVLIGNGTRDEVIPPAQGRELFALANEPKEYRSLPDRGHNDGFDLFAAVSLEWLRQL